MSSPAGDSAPARQNIEVTVDPKRGVTLRFTDRPPGRYPLSYVHERIEEVRYSPALAEAMAERDRWRDAVTKLRKLTIADVEPAPLTAVPQCA